MGAPSTVDVFGNTAPSPDLMQMIAALNPQTASKPPSWSGLPPGVAGTIPPPQQQQQDDEIAGLDRWMYAKRIAVAGALVGMFFVGYCWRGRVDAGKPISSNQMASLRAAAKADAVKATFEEAKPVAALQPTMMPAPVVPAPVAPAPVAPAPVAALLDSSKKADLAESGKKGAEIATASEDRASDTPSGKKKKGRKAKAAARRAAAAAAAAAAADAPAEAPEEDPQVVAAAQPVAPPAEEPQAAPQAAKADGEGNCTLNINSIPISRVAVDGRPVGMTPLLGVTVAAGTHNVLLVTDTLRKSTVTSCKAGESKTVSARLAL